MKTLSYLLRAGSGINQNYPVNLLCFITVQKNYTVKYTSGKLEKQKCIIFFLQQKILPRVKLTDTGFREQHFYLHEPAVNNLSTP